MNEHGKSDKPIVPKNPANKDDGDRTPLSAEPVEGRGLAKGNSVRTDRRRTQNRASLPSGLDRVRQAAQRDKGLRFTTLWHHVYSIERLREAYLGLKRDSAPGVDGQTWKQYGRDLEANLHDLSDRLKRGAYRAKPVKRVYIPKADGRQRPIGVPVLEDKIVQRAATTVLNAVYESDFQGFSYGFRPNRSAHDALDALSVALSTKKVNWVLDADIRGFFDAIDHEWLIKFVEHRIADQRVVRHIRKWLNAGVLEDGRRVQAETGSPQGGSISPLLANLYLHHAFDLWARYWRQEHACGDMIMVRYADDFVVGFETRADGERFLADLRVRFEKFNLELHPEKTRLLEFGRFAASNRQKRGEGKPQTFDFLGFVHICAKDRRGRFVVLRKTIAKRMRAKLKEIKAGLRRRMHQPVAEVGRWLRAVLNGYYRYYAVPRNLPGLSTFRFRIMQHWHRVLRRRSQKAGPTWKQMGRLASYWLPHPRILHPYPDVRFAVTTQGRSRMR